MTNQYHTIVVNTMTSDTLHILLRKIDRFIRRYYMNQLLKGLILFGAALFILSILFIGLEYVGYLPTNVRFTLFYAFIGFNGFVLIKYVILPLLGMIRIGKRISPAQAARLLGKYYPEEIQDKITNVIQLKDYLDKHPENAEIIMAGIDQKAKQTSVIPFHKAIPLHGNLRFIPYVLVPMIIIGGVYLMQPATLLEPAQRIVRYDVAFERPRPFQFEMQSASQAFRNDDVEVALKASGQVMPSEAYIVFNNSRYRLHKDGSDKFTHQIRNIQQDKRFYVEAEGFRFGPYDIDVLERASFTHFHIHVDYPEYTGLSDDEFTNMGDLSVIYGSEVTWTFFTNPIADVEFSLEDELLDPETVSTGEHRVRHTVDDSFDYQVLAYDAEHGAGDSIAYHVQMVRDEYPRIAVEEHRDDVLQAHLFYRGTIEDDFGFTGLDFHYRVMDQAQINRGEEVDFFTESMDIDPYLRNQTFHHHFDLQSIYVRPGETVEIYFTVYDNDPLKGPKGTDSRIFSHYIPTEEEILAERREGEERIEQGLEDGSGEVRQARDQIDELRKSLLDSERAGWEEREAMEQLLQKKEEMEKQLQEISDMKKETETRSEQFMESSERLQEKQQELQKLFDEVMSDEMKELFDRLRERLDEMSRDEIYEQLDQMDFEFQDMEMRMDRTLEMFRQFAMERLLEESINRLEQLSEQQEELREETGAGGDEDDIRDAQEQLNQSYEQIKDMLEEFRETNEKLSKPRDMQDTRDQEDAISDDLHDALDQLQQQNPDQAMPFQQDAGQKMQDLGDNLMQMQEEMFQQHLAEDARAIRMILENLLRSSFAQEDLLLETRQANVNDPQFPELIREQRKIESDMEMINDSLVALSQRQMAIQSFVTREVAEINHQMRSAIDHMINRRRHQSSSRQQHVMTHINNLALMLNESLQDIQQQMAMGEGMGEDQQPGEGQSFQNLREMQEQLNEMLEQMQDGFEPMPGETGDQPMSTSEQMARMAAEQEAIRNKLRELADEMRSQGEEGTEALQELQMEMEESELDMLRKELSTETLDRQERILTRLLEHERAERQQETEDRREGTTAEEWEISNPEDFFEYNRIREREVEMLRSLPPGLRPFYRSLVEQYFLHID